MTIHGILDHHVKLLPRRQDRGTFLKQQLYEVEAEAVDAASRRIAYTLDNLPIKRAVFIDSTWNQSRGIYKDPKISRLRTVVLQHRLTQFWRHQKNSPRWYLATIEGEILLFSMAVSRLSISVYIHSFSHPPIPSRSPCKCLGSQFVVQRARSA